MQKSAEAITPLAEHKIVRLYEWVKENVQRRIKADYTVYRQGNNRSKGRPTTENTEYNLVFYFLAFWNVYSMHE